MTLRQRLANEDGYTLMEMVVATAVGGIVILGVLTLMDASVTAQRKSVERVETTQRGRLAIDLITQQLRAQTCPGDGSSAILSATATSVEFYSSIGPENLTDGYQAPQRRTLTYNPGASGAPGTITETVYQGVGRLPTATFTAPPKTKVLVSDILPATTNAPIFTYYAYQGVSAAPTLLLTAPLVGADLGRTARIDVAFRALPRSKDGATAEVPFRNSVVARTGDPENLQGATPCA